MTTFPPPWEYIYIYIFFFKILFIYFFREGKGGRRRGRESICGCLLHGLHWRPGPQARHVPWLGIEPVTLWFTGQCSIHWDTPARAGIYYWIKFSFYYIPSIFLNASKLVTKTILLLIVFHIWIDWHTGFVHETWKEIFIGTDKNIQTFLWCGWNYFKKNTSALKTCFLINIRQT